MVSYTPGEYSMTMFSTLRRPPPPQRLAFLPRTHAQRRLPREAVATVGSAGHTAAGWVRSVWLVHDASWP
jgi:hypothetical protein